MSVILQTPEMEILLFSKGADSILLERMNQNKLISQFLILSVYIGPTWKNLENYAEDGLRTLLCCEKVLSQSLYDDWSDKYQDAITSMEDRENKMRDLQEELEVNLELSGATAIEDKLQTDVGSTISYLKETGIRVWVLTGDKIETAINIGYSCKLLSNNMEQLIVNAKEESEVSKAIKDNINKISSKNSYALIISGDSLIHALSSSISKDLMELASQCESVLCCRVSPKQKQEVVSLVRVERPQVISLAIGDGANDVNMITAAHVGIGIRGVEGQQAARASDYAIGEFRHLRRILLFHGRESYRKNSFLVCYNFYKNVMLVLPQFWYGFFNFFSGQTLYDKFLYQFFNLFYTSMPIVVYAVLDREFSGKLLERTPSMYIQGMRGELFNTRRFWSWVIMGTWQALFISLASFFSLGLNFINEEGHLGGFWDSGTMVFACCVIVANLKVLIFSSIHSPFSIFTIGCSVFIYIVSHIIVSLLKSSELYKSFEE